jgi:hypothetical protein
MQIADFPRPPEDNGRGIHWSARPHHPSGRDLEFWISELTAMHTKWVRLLDDGNGSSLELCRRLLEAGMMPVVGLVREASHPQRMDRRELSGVRKLISAGVCYIDTIPFPDGPVEHQAQRSAIVVEDFIRDADTIISEGGLPAAPDLGFGDRDPLLKEVVERGREDLFQMGTWLAIHNYTHNRPLNYPDDPVNRVGKPLAQEEYERLPAWAWDHRSLEAINQCRTQDRRPYQKLADDPHCFRYWEWVGQQVHDTLGYHIPVIAVGGGPVVGWGTDPRYPKVTPDLQREWQVEIVRLLQESAPAWYFSCCTWLLASRSLGDWNARWEETSWYTDLWNEEYDLAGQLPVVQAIRDLPPQIRPELRQGTGTLILTLMRADRDESLADVLVELESGNAGGPIRRFQAKTDAQGGLVLDRLPAAEYRLLVFQAEVDRIRLRGGERKAVALNVEAGRCSQLRGQVTDTNGAPQPDLMVTLHQQSPPRLLAETRSDRNGHYSFSGLPAGKVILRAAPGAAQAVERRNLLLDGWGVEEIDLEVPPVTDLRYEVVKKRLLTPAETGNDNFIFGRVLDENGAPLDGVTVRMRWTGAGAEVSFPTVKSGRNPAKARGYFEFIHTPGVFMLDIVDDEIESQFAENLVTADLPGHSRPISYEVIFQRKRTSRPTSQSIIQGRVMGGSPHLTVTLNGSGIRPRLMRLDPAGFFRFGDLPAGVYQVGLEGIGIISAEVILDGLNTAMLEFPMLGRIRGRVWPPDQPAIVILSSEQYGIRQEDDTNDRGEYLFANLPDDTYTLRLKGNNLPAQQVICDGRHTVDGPLFNRKTYKPEAAPPAQALIAGALLDHNAQPVANHTVLLRGPDSRQATTKEDGSFRFEGLPAGEYIVCVADLPGVNNTLSLRNGDQREVTLRLPSLDTTAQAVLEHYLFLATEDAEITAAQLALLLDYILHKKLAVGFSAEACMRAARVTIVGTVENSLLHTLREKNIPFHQVEGTLDNLEAEVEALP